MAGAERGISGPKDCVLWLEQQVPPDSLIIAMDDSVFVEYYAGLRCKSHPIGDREAMREWVREVNDALAGGTPVSIIGFAFSYDPGRVFRRTLRMHFEFEKVGSRRTEDSHRPELRFTLYESPLVRMQQRS